MLRPVDQLSLALYNILFYNNVFFVVKSVTAPKKPFRHECLETVMDISAAVLGLTFVLFVHVLLLRDQVKELANRLGSETEEEDESPLGAAYSIFYPDSGVSELVDLTRYEGILSTELGTAELELAALPPRTPVTLTNRDKFRYRCAALAHRSRPLLVTALIASPLLWVAVLATPKVLVFVNGDYHYINFDGVLVAPQTPDWLIASAQFVTLAASVLLAWYIFLKANSSRTDTMIQDEENEEYEESERQPAADKVEAIRNELESAKGELVQLYADLALDDQLIKEARRNNYYGDSEPN